MNIVSAGSGPVNQHTLGTQARQHGLHGIDLLAAEVAILPACGLRPATRMRGEAMPYLRRMSACTMRSVSSSIVASIASATARKGRCVVASATRNGPCGVSPASIITTRGVCGLRGEILGVSGERDAGLVDDALRNRCGNHCSKFAGTAARQRTIEQREHVGRIRRIQRPGMAGTASGQCRSSTPAPVAVCGR